MRYLSDSELKEKRDAGWMVTKGDLDRKTIPWRNFRFCIAATMGQ